MKLFSLTMNNRAGYDEVDGFVIRAKSEQRAREIANANCRGEGDIWDSPLHVDCEIITTSGDEGIILRDFRAG